MPKNTRIKPGNDPSAINQVTACGLLEYVPHLLSSDEMQNYLLVTSTADNENVDNAVCVIVLQRQTIEVNYAGKINWLIAGMHQ